MSSITCGTWTIEPPGRQQVPNPTILKMRNVVTPYVSLLRERKPQGEPMDVRVWQVGRSENHPVAGWIRVDARHESEQTSDWSFCARRILTDDQWNRWTGVEGNAFYGHNFIHD
ncbi:MAG: hypothetical protein ABSH41_28960 [Syntrophobacteraceae bacterium]|jgi:hypothetical protein